MKARYPIPPRAIKPTLSPVFVDPSIVFQKVHEALQEIESIKEAHFAQVDGKMQEIDAELQRLRALHIAHKGDKGDTPIPGVHFPVPTNGVNGRDGKDGQDGMTPVVDHELIAKKAAKLIKLPEIPKLEKIDPKAIAQAVIKMLQEDKPLTMEHVKGLTEEIASYRNQLAGKHYGSTTMVRGGGDVVTAGSNITITTDVNGQKVITSTSGGAQVPTGTVNGTNTTFTAATAPKVVFTEGGHFTNGFGVTITGLSIVFDSGLQPQSWIYYI